MADILGAAAGCGMMVLIMMLIFSFLVQIGVMKKETMAAAGRVFGRCGLFALGIDAAILLIAWVALGWVAFGNCCAGAHLFAGAVYGDGIVRPSLLCRFQEKR